MFVLKMLGKMISLPIVLFLLIFFYVVEVLSKIYNLAAVLFNVVFMLCAIISLFMHQWRNFWIAVVVLAISYLLLGAWDIVKMCIGYVSGCFYKKSFLPEVDLMDTNH